MNGQVIAGFAGAVADAFTLCERFEEKLTAVRRQSGTRRGQYWRRNGAVTAPSESWKAC